MTDQPLEPAEPRPVESGRHDEQTRIQPPAEEPPPPAPAPRAPERRLVRSQTDRVIAGVCGGLGRYLGVDPVLIRIAAIVLVFAGGAGVLLYVIGWIAIPEESAVEAAAEPTQPLSERTNNAVALGLVFIVLGAFFLADEIWPDLFSWRYVWPIALIGIGALILLRSKR